jgi:hypothetical protein
VKAIIEHSYTKVKETSRANATFWNLSPGLSSKGSIDGEELRAMLKEHAEGDHGNESR